MVCCIVGCGITGKRSEKAGLAVLTKVWVAEPLVPPAGAEALKFAMSRLEAWFK